MVQEKEAVQEAAAKYVVDPKWFEEHSRSMSTLLANRMCYNCKTRLEDNPDATAEEMFASIRDCCSQDEKFLEPGLPIQEAIFRLFLKEGNRPMDAEEIFTRIRDWLLSNRDTRLVSASIVERIMQNDRYYGFRRIEPQGEKAA